jgi:hypothetical protein
MNWNLKKVSQEKIHFLTAVDLANLIAVLNNIKKIKKVLTVALRPQDKTNIAFDVL